jgi:hypothetical protein
MHKPTVLTVSIQFSEDGEQTRADALLESGGVSLRGWGRARRNPTDPALPAIGEEIAAARALYDLGNHLMDQATHVIEMWEGHRVDVHR